MNYRTDDMPDEEYQLLLEIADVLEKSVTYGARSQVIARRFKDFADEWDGKFVNGGPMTVKEFINDTSDSVRKFGYIVTDFVEVALALMDTNNELAQLFENILKEKYGE